MVWMVCLLFIRKRPFYIFPRIDAKRFGIQNDEQFVLDFLREKHVLLVHGGGFNWANPDHFRIVYLPEVSVLTESMKKMDEFLENTARIVLLFKTVSV